MGNISTISWTGLINKSRKKNLGKQLKSITDDIARQSCNDIKNKTRKSSTGKQLKNITDDIVRP